jgi:hypothetical protein
MQAAKRRCERTLQRSSERLGVLVTPVIAHLWTRATTAAAPTHPIIFASSLSETRFRVSNQEANERPPRRAQRSSGKRKLVGCRCHVSVGVSTSN